MEETKVCSRCGEEKPFSEFYRQNGGKYGLRAACKKCYIASNTAWRARTGNKLRMGSKEYFRKLKKIKEGYSKSATVACSDT